MDEKKRLAEALAPGRKTVFFGGAGVSTESGLRDFRSAGGIYDSPYPFPPEEMVSRGYFDRDPAAFTTSTGGRWCRRRAPGPTPPTGGWRSLRRRERVIAVVTQNIDGLHQAAGSRVVYELHGSVHRNHCMDCRRPYGLDAVMNGEPVPRCRCAGASSSRMWCSMGRCWTMRRCPPRRRHRAGGYAAGGGHLAGGVSGGGSAAVF